MRAKRISSDEQFKLITECRQSGLSDYQWCQVNDINPGTFYNWISRLRKRGIDIPCAAEPVATEFQEVVKVELVPDHELMPQQTVFNDSPAYNTATVLQKPAVEILLGNSTIRFFHGADRELVETTLRCLGGNVYVG